MTTFGFFVDFTDRSRADGAFAVQTRFVSVSAANSTDANLAALQVVAATVPADSLVVASREA